MKDKIRQAMIDAIIYRDWKEFNDEEELKIYSDEELKCILLSMAVYG